MGSFSYSHSELGYGVRVGRYCSIGSGLRILGANHFPGWISTSPKFYEPDFHDRGVAVTDQMRSGRRIRIGNDVWIGAQATLARNIEIGDGAIIASGAMVTKNVPAFAIVGGLPAQFIRMRFAPEIVERICATQWWQYHLDDLKGLRADQPENFLDGLEQRIASGTLVPYAPPILTKSDILKLIASGPA
jgi:hypothetical protein